MTSFFNRLKNANDSLWVFFTVLLGLVFALLVVVTVNDYGVTFDEEAQRLYGDYVLAWYTSFFKDKNALIYSDLFKYGGFVELWNALLTRVSPLPVFETRHLFNTVFGFVAGVFTFKTASFLSSRRAGFFAVLCLALTPVFYGHTFFNSKDLPFAALYVTSVYFILKVVTQIVEGKNSPSQNVSFSMLLKLAVALGFCFGIRIGGVMLLVCLGIILGGLVLTKTLPLKKSAQIFLKVFALSWIFLLPFWPFAQTSPFRHPFLVLKDFSKFDWPGTILFQGEYISANHIPFTYLPVWFSVSLPEFYFVGLFCGLLFLLDQTFQKKALSRAKLSHVSALSVCLLFPPLYAILKQSTLYNGIRQFLFLIPLLSVFVALGFDLFLKTEWSARMKLALTSVFIFFTVQTVLEMKALHPYEALYFNHTSGGIEREWTEFETDYWGFSHFEALKWLAEKFPEKRENPIIIGTCMNSFLLAEPLKELKKKNPNLSITVTANGENHFLFFNRMGEKTCVPVKKTDIVHEVRRKGVPLTGIVQMNPIDRKL